METVRKDEERVKRKRQRKINPNAGGCSTGCARALERVPEKWIRCLCAAAAFNNIQI